jgi:hypothetical protein
MVQVALNHGSGFPVLKQMARVPCAQDPKLSTAPRRNPASSAASVNVMFTSPPGRQFPSTLPFTAMLSSNNPVIVTVVRFPENASGLDITCSLNTTSHPKNGT